MICQKCGLLEATVHREEVVYRQRIEEHLCASCANLSMLSEPHAALPWKFSHEIDSSEDSLIVENGGFGQIEDQVSRLLQSTSASAFLLIATFDEEDGVSIWNRDGVLEFSFFIDWHYRPELEQAIRTLFARRGLSASRDYLAGNGAIPDATRCISYAISPQVRVITDVAKEILSISYGLAEGESLKFIHNEFKTA